MKRKGILGSWMLRRCKETEPSVRPLQRSKREPPLPIISGLLHNCARCYSWTIVVVVTGVDRKANSVILPTAEGNEGTIRITHMPYDIETARKLGWL
jgi:hypothetical protein